MQEYANGAMRNAQPDSQSEQQPTAVTDAAGKPMDAEPAESAQTEALRQELSKWQERVPKLAGALRERTAELEALKVRLSEQPAAAQNSHDTASGIKARDSLITELEAKLKSQSSRHQDAQGQLHARDVEIAELKEELGEWRSKWQSTTENLDAQADSLAGKDADLIAAREELEMLRHYNRDLDGKLKARELDATALQETAKSLEARNEKLFETTEMANRQIESLGDSLNQLRQQTKANAAELDARAQQLTELESQLLERDNKLASRDQDIEFLHGHVESKQTEIGALQSQVAELSKLQAEHARVNDELAAANAAVAELETRQQALTEELDNLGEVGRLLQTAEEKLSQQTSEAEQRSRQIAELTEQLREQATASNEQSEEIKRLEDCVAQATEANEAREVERRQLSEQMAELKTRNQHLEAQLEERSSLVVGLEQEKSAIHSKTESMDAENRRLSEALDKAQRHAAEHAEHIAHLDARMERQKNLMASLEQEYAQAQQEAADAQKAHARQLQQKESELLSIREKHERDSAQSNVSSEELTAVVAELEVARAALEESKSAEQAQLDALRQNNDDLSRELDQLRNQEDAARVSLQEKAEKLEKQLRKQSKENSGSQEQLASVTAKLEKLEKTKATPNDDNLALENEDLQAEIQKLEGMVRDRTEQLNKMRWRQQMQEQQQASGESDEKLLIVLNQQLTASREDNQRLIDQVRQLEDRLARSQDAGDDLSRIRGIGPKLVAQLEEYDITSFAQIADLIPEDLEAENHPLHALRGRIAKDEWIAQAHALELRD